MHRVTLRCLALAVVLLLVFTTYRFHSAFAQSDTSGSSTPTDSSSSSSTGTSTDTSSTSASTDNSTPILPPTAPPALQIQTTSGGMLISWNASQPGTYPLDHYVVQTSSDNTTYQDLTNVDASTTSYTDANGQAGEWYRVVAVDNQSPANQSTPSDAAQAPASQSTIDTSLNETPSPSSTNGTSSSQPPQSTDNTSTATPPSNSTDNGGQATVPDNTSIGTDVAPVQNGSQPTQIVEVNPSDPKLDITISNIDQTALLSNPTSSSSTPSTSEDGGTLTNTTTPSPLAPPDAVLPPANPAVVATPSDTATTQVFRGMNHNDSVAVTDESSLNSQITNDDRQDVVQSPSKSASLLSSYSDSHIVNLNDVIKKGQETLVAPLLSRFNYEKTSVISLHDRLTKQDINTTKSHCSAQTDLLSTDVFILPDNQWPLAIEGIADCAVINSL